ncbi:hypothetical protein [Rhodoblastus sp.]|uniref:hypothetical protein n=1 Tax=Rhodoblastus sp. TaxID=1962975 RepID=UPI003F9BF064
MSIYIYDQRNLHDRGANTFFVDWFSGSFEAALRILNRLGDATSEATQFWTVGQFDDDETGLAFFQIWKNAKIVDGRIVVPDIIALQWLRDQNVRVVECVEMVFWSKKSRADFIAQTDP